MKVMHSDSDSERIALLFKDESNIPYNVLEIRRYEDYKSRVVDAKTNVLPTLTVDEMRGRLMGMPKDDLKQDDTVAGLNSKMAAELEILITGGEESAGSMVEVCTNTLENKNESGMKRLELLTEMLGVGAHVSQAAESEYNGVKVVVTPTDIPGIFLVKHSNDFYPSVGSNPQHVEVYSLLHSAPTSTSN